MLDVATYFKETALLFNLHLSCFVDFVPDWQIHVQS